ncbi:hypothetical protein [Aldersonia kunmingensis]|uniref:hypothetical protein n=1 Tax=Aldersonia kunmingensis TaxID=408066 RepID=UPI00082B377F|nr:hypothetical protein [Aldersonia kunmingensis]
MSSDDEQQPGGGPQQPDGGADKPGTPSGADGPATPAGADGPGTPAGGQPPAGQPEQQAPRRGKIGRQEPGVTQPRQPTVGEARARQQARKKQAELERIQREHAARRKKRNRRLIGGAAVVGVVAVVAVGYKVLSAHENVTARCVVMEDGREVVVEDRYCGGSPGMNGIFIVGGSQYRYYYGGTGTIGQSPTGGSTVKPKGAEIKTSSGTTVQRGGLGAKVGGSSGS